MNTISTNKTKYLKDYKPCDFQIEKVDLDFSLFDNQTIVTSKIKFSKTNKRVKNLNLVGEDLSLVSIAINGNNHKNYELTTTGITIRQVPEEFTLSTQVIIHTEKNTLLEGLYRSSNIFCTQCEAEGFRRITYFLDRPDVMTTYKVRIEADKDKYPILLSNGNFIESGDTYGNRHFSIWHDPFAKPSYLFALVAGDLSMVEKPYKTLSGKDVSLQVYTEKEFIDKAQYALGAMERSLRWDEETFNLEYDLERYMIVAINDFNMGAMENKGLNIFNTEYVLATTETSSDRDFLNIENIIGHEYFHNWSGNRVTCRDWFQLSLKEGLTVFRDALFSADMTTKGIKRLEEVRTVREHQFIEDQGPMSHPVRPDNYIKIDNFYTLTVYEKGSEIIRMMYNLIGEHKFKEGIALYFKRHDGQAVTVEDFVKSMSDASGYDFMGQFFLWYTQSGTPELRVNSEYDESSRIFKIHLEQYNAPTAGQSKKDNLVIPISYRLYNKKGEPMSSENVIVLDDKEKTIEFGSIKEKPILSLLRNFSAPVVVKYNQENEDLHTLVKHDDDLFIRFDAIQLLLKRCVSNVLNNDNIDESNILISNIADTLAHVINRNSPDAEKSELLTLPELQVFYDIIDKVDVDKLSDAVEKVKSALIKKITPLLYSIIKREIKFDPQDLSFAAISERSFHNTCLKLLATQKDDNNIIEIAKQKFYSSKIMTNKLAALSALNNKDCTLRTEALENFYNEYSNDPLVTDKWLAIQAVANFDNIIDTINDLSKHSAFSITTPNNVRSLYRSFFTKNPVQFHHKSGRGYNLLTDVVIKLDKINPSMSSSMVNQLTQWRTFDEERQKLMRSKLEFLLNIKGISKNLYEIVSKSLEDI